ncbi:MAG: hypothetical protein ETSY2_48995 [Candidatus Entotheonella gemina]|uniref:Uncharacterized protein n=1 Tax=Candidatus Entotheonella gemina TaxID=1429439 RepID=W4LA51_9BACT|nr:MAG: hypothetical protein ETSY2_48995 [Candidatus Entotheonella gemina]
MSAVCHELIDYETRINQQTIMTNTLKELKRILNTGGKLIIREPIVPENPTQMISLTLSKTQKVTATRAQVAAVYANLTEAELFEKFIQEWIFLDDASIRSLTSPNADQQARYAVPAWIVAEYARKRTFIDYVGNWQSEMHELNAAFAPQDIQAYAIAAGFKPTHIQFETLMEDDYYGEFKDGDGIILTDSHGVPIDQATLLPSHMYMLIEV